MRIGLISDTHIPVVAPILPPEVARAFEGVDLILHAGDIYVSAVLDELERIAPVLAAKGDDDSSLTAADKRVKDKHVLKFDSKVVWLIHEPPHYFLMKARQATNLEEQSDVELPDIVVFGHEHRTFLYKNGNVLMVNPGSPTFLHYRYELGTVGILELNSGEPHASIVDLATI